MKLGPFCLGERSMNIESTECVSSQRQLSNARVRFASVYDDQDTLLTTFPSTRSDDLKDRLATSLFRTFGKCGLTSSFLTCSYGVVHLEGSRICAHNHPCGKEGTSNAECYRTVLNPLTRGCRSTPECIRCQITHQLRARAYCEKFLLCQTPTSCGTWKFESSIILTLRIGAQSAS